MWQFTSLAMIVQLRPKVLNIRVPTTTPAVLHGISTAARHAGHQGDFDELRQSDASGRLGILRLHGSTRHTTHIMDMGWMITRIVVARDVQSFTFLFGSFVGNMTVKKPSRHHWHGLATKIVPV